MTVSEDGTIKVPMKALEISRNVTQVYYYLGKFKAVKFETKIAFFPVQDGFDSY